MSTTTTTTDKAPTLAEAAEAALEIPFIQDTVSAARGARLRESRRTVEDHDLSRRAVKEGTARLDRIYDNLRAALAAEPERPGYRLEGACQSCAAPMLDDGLCEGCCRADSERREAARRSVASYLAGAARVPFYVRAYESGEYDLCSVRAEFAEWIAAELKEEGL